MKRKTSEEYYFWLERNLEEIKRMEAEVRKMKAKRK